MLVRETGCRPRDNLDSSYRLKGCALETRTLHQSCDGQNAEPVPMIQSGLPGRILELESWDSKYNQSNGGVNNTDLGWLRAPYSTARWRE
jgi:hypothetical protein